MNNWTSCELPQVSGCQEAKTGWEQQPKIRNRSMSCMWEKLCRISGPNEMGMEAESLVRNCKILILTKNRRTTPLTLSQAISFDLVQPWKPFGTSLSIFTFCFNSICVNEEWTLKQYFFLTGKFQHRVISKLGTIYFKRRNRFCQFNLRKYLLRIISQLFSEEAIENDPYELQNGRKERICIIMGTLIFCVIACHWKWCLYLPGLRASEILVPRRPLLTLACTHVLPFMC